MFHHRETRNRSRILYHSYLCAVDVLSVAISVASPSHLRVAFLRISRLWILANDCDDRYVLLVQKAPIVLSHVRQITRSDWILSLGWYACGGTLPPKNSHLIISMSDSASKALLKCQLLNLCVRKTPSIQTSALPRSRPRNLRCATDVVLLFRVSPLPSGWNVAK